MQIDVNKVVEKMAAEIAVLTQRAVIAEASCEALEGENARLLEQVTAPDPA